MYEHYIESINRKVKDVIEQQWDYDNYTQIFETLERAFLNANQQIATEIQDAPISGFGQEAEQTRTENQRPDLEEYKKHAEENEALTAENRELRQQVARLQEENADLRRLLQYKEDMGKERGSEQPEGEVRPTSEIQQARKKWEATKAIDVVVEPDGAESEESEEREYIAPRHRETYEARPSSVLNTIVELGVLGAENKVYKEKEERRREQVRKAVKKHEQKKRQDNPDEVRLKNTEKNRKWREKKAAEAKSSSVQHS